MHKIKSWKELKLTAIYTLLMRIGAIGTPNTLEQKVDTVKRLAE